MTQYPYPSEIMRQRRPYLYSDSSLTDAYRLSESELSHHLETLTDRNQHKDFENFCRKISEREICRNLRPQTGPEGGGDGKVDTETYPVDEKISERWFIGDANGGKEKWAFAFSAKKSWSEKVRSDVQGIFETERNYHRIFFFTSRAARQRDRIRIEEELLAEYGIEVSILDREWLIDRVFSNGHQDIAYECLKAGAIEPEKVKLGPNDFKRQQALDEIEERLSKHTDNPPDLTQAVSDTFEAARLSRELEKPRFQTDGRFLRAIDYSKKYGTSYQRLRAVYEHAWTSFWWFDDVQALNERYEEIEDMAFASGHASHVSKVCNIHQVFVGRVLQGWEPAEELSLSDRTARLKTKLSSLASDKSRPNNALYSETLLVFHHMNEKFLAGESETLDEIWNALSKIIDRAAGLGEYPADLLDTMIDAISERAPDSIAFDNLVEKLAEFIGERNREATAARIYLTQGEKKLNAEKPIDAIKWLGRAVLNFAKDECREEQGKALYFLSVGYRGAGLYWAARATALASVVQYLALSELESELRVETIPTLNLLALLSLQLGHITDFLSAIQFIRTVGAIAPLDDDSRKRLEAQLTEFDHFLACLLVVQPKEQIARLASLPDILENLVLFAARFALLYRLGHLEEAKSDGSVPEGTSDEEIAKIIQGMSSQPICDNLPRKLILSDDKPGIVRTRLLGVEIEISADKTEKGSLLAEIYSTALEGFAATLLNAKLFPLVEKFRISISESVDENKPEISLDEENAILSASLPSTRDLLEIENISALNRHLISVNVQALTHFFSLAEAMKTMKELIETEQAFERATLFCHTGISRHRVLGREVGQLSDWQHWINKTYELKDEAPDALIVPTKVAAETNKSADDRETLSQFPDMQNHSDVVVRSVINMKLWDGAAWQGLLYGWADDGRPPFLGVWFENQEKGKAIFEEWKEKFGRIDDNDEIRISVIKGINKENPFYYRGCIMQNPDNILDTDSTKRFFNITRMKTMEPSNDINLSSFMSRFELSGSYFLVPAFAEPGENPKFCFDLAILKRKFHVREAWQIGPHDFDAIAVRSDDDVIIPDGQDSAPVHQLFKWRSEIEKSNKHNDT